MIEIAKSPTAGSRTCDWKQVTETQLLASSEQHISDVRRGLEYFKGLMTIAAATHDADKVTNLAGFHADFATGFKQTHWLDHHRRTTRHHLQRADDVPMDVNLIDVLEMIVDGVMAGLGRAGEVTTLEIAPDILQLAFDNTADLLESQVVVRD